MSILTLFLSFKTPNPTTKTNRWEVNVLPTLSFGRGTASSTSCYHSFKMSIQFIQLEPTHFHSCFSPLCIKINIENTTLHSTEKIFCSLILYVMSVKFIFPVHFVYLFHPSKPYNIQTL